jgi:biotin carboxylase
MDLQDDGTWYMNDLINSIAFKMRSIGFDKFVALDDFDVDQVAYLREHFRMPGMGSTTARYFRDKLAMRMKAEEHGIPVPGFTNLFIDQDIQQFVEQVPGPWLLKPRSEASATGIKKLHSAEELWETVNGLQDHRHRYLVERFAPGDVYHVDSLISGGEVVFCKTSRYLDTPFEVAHGGGIFRSATLEIDSEDDLKLKALNQQVQQGFGMQHSASHTEFIKSHETGEFYFLETSARVGGANLAEMVEASSGINLWREWAHIELAVSLDETYDLPDVKQQYAGIVVSLSRYQHPDTSTFTDPEICWRMDKEWHIGLIVRSNSADRVRELLDLYAGRIAKEYHASLEPPDATRL